MNILKLFEIDDSPLIIAKIINKTSLTQCLVQDNKNRQYIAESDGSYLIGQTVIIKNGIIVSRTKSFDIIKEFVV